MQYASTIDTVNSRNSRDKLTYDKALLAWPRRYITMQEIKFYVLYNYVYVHNNRNEMPLQHQQVFLYHEQRSVFAFMSFHYYKKQHLKMNLL